MTFDVLYTFGLVLVNFLPQQSVNCFYHNEDCRKHSLKGYKLDYVMALLPEIFPFKPKRPCEESNSLIVGGQNAMYGEFPHMAAIGSSKNNIIKWICGGSLIHKSYVLTAAHCTSSNGLKADVVRLGTVNIDSWPQLDVEVRRAIVHPNYRPPVLYNDIALLQLKAEINFSEYVRPACLSPIKNLTKIPDPVVVATGWGYTSFAGVSSSHLLKVSLRVINSKDCERHFQLEKQLPRGITDSLFCAVGHIEPSHDTCQGDSGGPLQIPLEGDSCTKEIIGITSFGKYCGTGSPAVYVKVAHYAHWIEEEINNAEE